MTTWTKPYRVMCSVDFPDGVDPIIRGGKVIKRQEHMACLVIDALGDAGIPYSSISVTPLRRVVDCTTGEIRWR